ncbi:hypothetical protein [Vibrio genomosp. F6]|uniref:Uncharacterized protein n=1 Tax=Vibrio genomosp. F6 str. FF-238 TaxID=1191298 RepID=A0A1E5D4Z5_9VIBR|nr:hypothetical protein [Vibrio genomosp. F6]OEE78614.1 hypothetical protein A130_13010 [Vibrio genomosp. F6 str. FF-238]
MLLMTRQYFPFINFNDFKKIIVNLHKHSCRSDIPLSKFKNEVALLIGYENFSHLKNSIEQTKKDQLLIDYGNEYEFSYSCGMYLLDALSAPIRKLLQIPFDLYTDVIEQQYIRFTNKKPYLVIDGKVYNCDHFSKGIEDSNKDKTLALLCLAKNESDAIASFWTTKLEGKFNHITSFYDDSEVNDVRPLTFSHLTPPCASTLSIDMPVGLRQLKRPEIALCNWADANKNEELLKLLQLASNDTKFRCRIYLDEYTHDVKLSPDLSIKADRVYTIEVSTQDGIYIGPLDQLYLDLIGTKINLDTFSPQDVIDHVYAIQKHLASTYGEKQYSIYILSNGIKYLESLDKNLVMSLSEALAQPNPVPNHLHALLKAFCISESIIK